MPKERRSRRLNIQVSTKVTSLIIAKVSYMAFASNNGKQLLKIQNKLNEAIADR